MRLTLSRNSNQWVHALLLLVWLVLGLSLRLANLAEKSPSSIEISTLGFSLGQGFVNVPLDRLISLDTLLSPLQFDPNTSARDVVVRLMSESNHPPLYFLLTHFWLQLFSHPGELASLWVGRSLSAIWGAASIPAMFGLGWLAFRSRSVGQIAAALIAVSPYGIYLAQEARHYTLTILWLIASLSCLVVAARCISQQKPLPIWVGCSWVVVNGLGLATHYFFSLALGAEAIVIGGLWLKDWRLKRMPLEREYWRRIYGVIAGTAIAGLVWLPVLAHIPDPGLADWSGQLDTSYQLAKFWQPLPRLLAWWVTMVFLLPVEGVGLGVAIVSALVVLAVLLWVSPAVLRGLRVQMQSLTSRLSVQVLAGFVLGAIAIFLLIIYGLGKDLSLAARYHFVYFPAAVAVVGAALASSWTEKNSLPRPSLFKAEGKKVVVAVLLLGFLGALTVVSNYGYQKSRRSDLLVPYIQNFSPDPPLIAMTYETHADLRALMGLAFDFQRLAPASAEKLKFILVKKEPDKPQAMQATLATNLSQLRRPLALWAVNLDVEQAAIEALGCSRDERKPSINGYRVRLYHCR